MRTIEKAKHLVSSSSDANAQRCADGGFQAVIVEFGVHLLLLMTWATHNFLYGTMAFLVINTVVHYYTGGAHDGINRIKTTAWEWKQRQLINTLPQYKLFFNWQVPVCFFACDF